MVSITAPSVKGIHLRISIRDPWHFVRIRILGSVPVTNGFDADPAFFVSDLQDADKKNFLSLQVFMFIPDLYPEPDPNK